jgi:hypothetical protein
MRRASYGLIVAPVVLVASCASLVFVTLKQENEYEAQQARWQWPQSAHKLVMQDLEGMKADRGRYPERLTPADVSEAAGTLWFYRVNADGTDYELWCKIPQKEGGFDAMIFSPDGEIGDDWPGKRPSPGGVWTLVEHAELSPTERWLDPVNP